MFDTDRLDLEWADSIAGGNDYVVGAPRVPDVAVVVHHRRILCVEPLAAERLARRLLVPPITERVVRVRARTQTNLAALSPGDFVLVLVEDMDVPSRHRSTHRSFAHLHPRVIRNQRIRLRQPVVIEHRDAVLLPEPANRLRIERLTGRAHAPELAPVAVAGV